MFTLLAWGSNKAWAVPWDIGIVFKALSDISRQIGIVFNIGIWVFLGISGIYIVLKIIDGLAH